MKDVDFIHSVFEMPQASQLTSDSIAYLTTYAGQHEIEHQSPALPVPLWRKPPVTCRFPSERSSNAERVPMPW